MKETENIILKITSTGKTLAALLNPVKLVKTMGPILLLNAFIRGVTQETE
ncbi:MAG: hypothetical protein ACXADY_17570 [Candidatus Hodarchaeales archaeon]